MGKDVKIGIGVALCIGLLLFVFLVIRGGNQEKAGVPVAAPTPPGVRSASGTPANTAASRASTPVALSSPTVAQSSGGKWTTLKDLEPMGPGTATQEQTAEAEILGTPAKPPAPAVGAAASGKPESPASTVTTPPLVSRSVTPAPPTSVVEVASPAPTGQTYTAQKGDTLWSVAIHFYGEGRRWNKIYEANRDVLSSSSALPVGAVLVIPPAEGQSAAAEAAAPSVVQPATVAAGGKTHTVERDDTLYGIARKEYGDGSLWRTIYEVNREQIPGPPEQLRTGAVLVIPPASQK